VQETNQSITSQPSDISPHNKVSKVWLIPMLALVISCWMVADTYLNKGPEVVISFANAEGLEAGKTRVKTLNVDIGYVSRVQLNESRDGVVVHATLDKQVSEMLTENAQFWVVKPKIGSGGISGLGTLTSGSYIEFVTGDSARASLVFQGLEEAPITAKGIAGVRLNLVSEQGDSLNIGEPVLYRGFEVGRVERSDFNIAKREVHYQIFVRSPYSELLTENTYFWNSSGIDFSANAQGINVNVGSIESIIRGGVAFDVPIDLPLGDAIRDDKLHTLYPDKNSVYEQRQYASKEFTVLFEDSVRGLQQGAPVEYRGIRVGTVKNIVSVLGAQDGDDATQRRIPVVISIEPARIGLTNEQASLDRISHLLEKWTKQGLKASLKSGSLLTGSLFVDLDYYDVTVAHVGLKRFNGEDVIPSVSGSLAQIEQKVFAILDKFEQMPINITIDSINTMLDSANTTMTELNQAIGQVKKLLSQSQTQAIPTHLNQALEELSNTLKGFNQQAPVYNELEQTLVDFQQLMREAQPFIKELNNKPNSLIFESKVEMDIEPKGKSNE